MSPSMYTVYIKTSYIHFMYLYKVCTLLYVNYALMKLFLEVKKNILSNFKNNKIKINVFFLCKVLPTWLALST